MEDQNSEPMPEKFGILELHTGIIDGWYPSRAHAQAIADQSFRKNHEWGTWVVIGAYNPHDDDLYIPDSKFYPEAVTGVVPVGVKDLRTACEYLSGVRRWSLQEPAATTL